MPVCHLLSGLPVFMFSEPIVKISWKEIEHVIVSAIPNSHTLLYRSDENLTKKDDTSYGLPTPFQYTLQSTMWEK